MQRSTNKSSWPKYSSGLRQLRERGKGIRRIQQPRPVRCAGAIAILSAILAGPPAVAQTFFFSVDIGSDVEMSDPFVNGNESLDPGDLYFSGGAPGSIVVLGGIDGFIDDLRLLNIDMPPDPWDPGLVTAVDVLGGCPPPGPATCYQESFDLDAYDGIVFQLSVSCVGIDPLTPLSAPLRYDDLDPSDPGCTWVGHEDCIADGTYLAISFDDDDDSGWGFGGASHEPVNSTGSLGKTYGTTAGGDELLGIVVGGTSYPRPHVAVYPIASEEWVHPDLAPNPDVDESSDDDIDALDLVGCDNFVYFSADSEARAFLDPGIIYTAVPLGTPTPALQGSVHFGLPLGVDIDAFELVWLPHPTDGICLAALFSVDNDDPRTGSDESGGLDPGAIYGSWLTGSYFEYVATDSLMYGISRGGLLYAYDKATGATLNVGDLSSFFGVGSNQAIAADTTNQIYVLGPLGNEIVAVNLADPSSSAVRTLTGPGGAPVAAAFDSTDALFVVISSSTSANSQLYRLDLATGTYTHVGDTGLTGVNCIAFDASDALYAYDLVEGLCTLDPSTGSYIDLLGGAFVGGVEGLVFDVDDTLFAIQRDTTTILPFELVDIDLSCTPPCANVRGSTGRFDLQGSAIIDPLGDDIDAIAAADYRFVPAGAPASVTWGCVTGVNDWSTTACWSGLIGGDPYPDLGNVIYDVTLPGGAYTVQVNPPGDTEIIMDGPLEVQGADTTLEVAAGVSFVVNDSATMRGRLRVLGGSLTAGPAANADIDGATMDVQAGGVLRLTSVAYDALGSAVPLAWQASGANSQIELPNLATIVGASAATLTIEAAQSARVDLSALTSVSGDVEFHAHEFNANPAVIDCPQLDRLGLGARIRVRTGGAFFGAPLVDVSGVRIEVQGTASQLDTSQIVSMDDARVFVDGGAVVSFPGVTSYRTGVLDCDQHALRAKNPNSELHFPALRTIDAGPCTNIALRAEQSGQLYLPALTDMSGRVDIYAQNPDALIVIGNISICDPNSLVNVQSGAEIRVLGSMSYAITNPSAFGWVSGANPATLSMLGGAPGNCATLEVGGADLGNDPAGWVQNFHLDRLVIGPDAHVTLVDAFDNTAGTEPEALYVDTLEFSGPGTGRLYLNGLSLHYNVLVGDPAQIDVGACAAGCPADLDGDGEIGLGDLAMALAAYGSCVGDPGYLSAFDFDGSGCNDLSDLSWLLGNYGSPCE